MGDSNLRKPPAEAASREWGLNLFDETLWVERMTGRHRVPSSTRPVARSRRVLAPLRRSAPIWRSEIDSDA